MNDNELKRILITLCMDERDRRKCQHAGVGWDSEVDSKRANTRELPRSAMNIWERGVVNFIH